MSFFPRERYQLKGDADWVGGRGGSRCVEPEFDSAFRNRTSVRIDLSSLQIERVKAGQGVGPVARELGLVEQTLRNWVKAAERGQLNPPGAKVITPEQMELSRLRAENARLRMECEILKIANSRKMCCEVRLD